MNGVSKRSSEIISYLTNISLGIKLIVSLPLKVNVDLYSASSWTHL